MNRNLHVLLFAHPRSGSTSLYQILQLHPELNLLEEPFNEHYTQWNRDNKNYLELIHDIPSLDVQVTEIFRSYNGIKMLDYQLPEPLAIHLLQRPDCKVIFLRRRNILQAIVSVLIARQTMLWKKWEMTKPLEEYYRGLQPIDVEDVQRRVAGLKEHLDLFEAVIERRAKEDTLKLAYEDLYYSEVSRQHQQIDALWNLLGITPLERERYQYYLQPEVKINSRETYAFLPNAREIHEHCGNDRTGWLFE